MDYIVCTKTEVMATCNEVNGDMGSDGFGQDGPLCPYIYRGNRYISLAHKSGTLSTDLAAERFLDMAPMLVLPELHLAERCYISGTHTVFKCATCMC